MVLLVGTIASGQTASPAPAAAGGEETKAAVPPAPAGARKSWYSPMKDIPAGPGRLDVGFGVRARYEWSDNFDVRRYGTETSDDLMLLRTRVSFDYKFTDRAHVFLELQDSRYWLSDLRRSLWEVNNPFYDEIDVRQAYAEWKHIGGTPFGFKAGRQSIAYGDMHVFGPGEWGNVGRYWWDAAKLYCHTDPVQVDLLYGQRIISEPTSFNDTHFPYEMFGAYAKIRQQSLAQLSLQPDVFYLVNRDDHGTIAGEHGKGDQLTHSFGLYVNGTVGTRWDFACTSVGQLGKYGRDDVEAFGTNARAGYTLEAPWSPRLGAEFTYASGDDDPTDGVHETFDGVFGAADLYYYGSMNLCCWMNLEDYQATFRVKPRDDLTLRLDHHWLHLAESEDAWYWSSGRPARRDGAGGAGRDLGQELNVVAQWQVDKDLELFTGYGHFFAGEYLRKTPGSDHDADWLFLQCTYKF